MKPTEEGVEESQATAEVKPLQSVVQIDERRIQAHLDAVVRSTVQILVPYRRNSHRRNGLKLG